MIPPRRLRCWHCNTRYAYQSIGDDCHNPLNDDRYCPSCKALIIEALKDVTDAFTYGLSEGMVGIDFETQGFEALLPPNPWIPGYPMHGLFGTAYDLKGKNGLVTTVIADFQEFGAYPGMLMPASYFKCHLEDGTTLRVPHRDIEAHRENRNLDLSKIAMKVKMKPTAERVELDVHVGPDKPQYHIGLASPSDQEMAEFLVRNKPKNRSATELTLFLRQFEYFLATYWSDFKGTYRSSSAHENISNGPKSVYDQDIHHRRRRRRM